MNLFGVKQSIIMLALSDDKRIEEVIFNAKAIMRWSLREVTIVRYLVSLDDG